jgi:mannosyltransferase
MTVDQSRASSHRGGRSEQRPYTAALRPQPTPAGRDELPPTPARPRHSVLSTQYSVLICSRLAVGILTAAGLALRLADLGRESFWLDEAGRAAIAALPLGAIPHAVGVVELSPPLYHLLLHGWLRLVGGGDFALRLLSALLGAAAIPATYALGRELVGRRAALLAALLAAVAPLYVGYAQEAAMYALFALLALGAALAHARFVRSGSTASLLAYALAMLLALYTHYYALFLLAAQNGYLLWLARRGALPAERRRRWLLAQAGLALAFAPWLPFLARQSSLAASATDWAAPDLFAALGGLTLAFTVGDLAGVPALAAAALFLPALGAGAWALRRWPDVLALLACYALVPLALGLLAAAPLHAFRERGFIAVAWVPHVLIATGLVGLGGGARALWSAPRGWPAWAGPCARAAYGAALLALLLQGTAALLAAPKEDWRSAAALIAALGREGDVIYLMHYGGQLALDRYLPPGLPRRGLPADFDWERGYTAPYRLEAADLDARLAPDLRGRRRAWAVLSHADGRGDQLLLDYLDARYPAMLRQDFYGVRVRLWAVQPGS